MSFPRRSILLSILRERFRADVDIRRYVDVSSEVCNIPRGTASMGSDDPVKPIRPIAPIRAFGDIELRRRPSLGQLRQWIDFVQRKNRDKKRSGQSGNDADKE
jgi:hypothetical protein